MIKFTFHIRILEIGSINSNPGVRTQRSINTGDSRVRHIIVRERITRPVHITNVYFDGFVDVHVVFVTMGAST